jgi:Cdc6-like AAA superfamily ATPase
VVHVKVDLGLQVAANAFIDALTPIVESVRHTPKAESAAVRREVALEAFALACAFIDSDRRAADEELWSLIVAFAPVLDQAMLRQTPADLRAAGTTEGKRHYLDHPSALFAELLAADARTHTAWTTTYYEHAVALGFMTASLDSYTDRLELVAIEQFRSMLLVAIRTGKLPSDTSSETSESDGSANRAASGTADGGPASSAPASPAADAATADATKTAAEVEAEALPPPRPLEDLLDELDDLVGMKAVKEEIKLVTNLLRVQKLRAERGLKTMESSHHLIFTGNPGTGKTTVARLLCQIYRTLGVVARGQLIETDRAGLVAGFVGQTATKVVEAFDRADQGVLLIDEAYALVRGSENDFGQEAIDTIVKLVEDRRDRIVVIAAGYPDEMADFVSANPGLSSRFPKTILFPDYSTDELLQIFQHLCDDANYLCDADAKTNVRHWLDSQPRVKGFGNGRLVRNLFENAVARQASRVVDIKDPTDIQLVLLLPADIPDLPDLPDRPDLAVLPDVGLAPTDHQSSGPAQ